MGISVCRPTARVRRPTARVRRRARCHTARVRRGSSPMHRYATVDERDYLDDTELTRPLAQLNERYGGRGVKRAPYAVRKQASAIIEHFLQNGVDPYQMDHLMYKRMRCIRSHCMGQIPDSDVATTVFLDTWDLIVSRTRDPKFG